MKVIVERDGFAEAITAAIRAAGKANTIPILNNVLLTPNGSTLGIAGTSLDQQLETSVPAEISGAPGAMTVLGSALSDIVNRMPAGAQLTIEWEESAKGATIKSGRSRYKLLTLPPTDFPELMKPKEPVTFSMLGKELAAGLSAVRFAMNKGNDRWYLKGTYVHAGMDGRELRLFFAATDGKSAAVASFAGPDGSKNMPGVIIPDVAVPEMIRLATDAKDDPVELSITSTVVSLTSAGKTFSTKLIDGTFPDYVRVIPVDPDKRMTVDCDELSGALSRLLSIGDGLRTRAAIEDGTLCLTLINADVGDAAEEISVEWESSGPLSIGIKANSILEILDSMQSDTCLIRFTDASSPVLIQPLRAGVVDGSRTYVTMPVA